MQSNLLPVCYPATFFIQLLVNSRRLCLVAIEGGTIVGFASATMGLLQPSSEGGHLQAINQGSSLSRPDFPRTRVTLLTLGVMPAYQRKGIGRALVHGVIQSLEASCGAASQPYKGTSSDHAQATNKDNKITVLVQVQVAPSNSAGRCFYTRLGITDQKVSDDPRLHLGPVSQASVMAGVLSV